MPQVRKSDLVGWSGSLTGDAIVQPVTLIQKIGIVVAMVLFVLFVVMVLLVLFGVKDVDVTYITAVGGLLGVIFYGLLNSNRPSAASHDDGMDMASA